MRLVTMCAIVLDRASSARPGRVRLGSAAGREGRGRRRDEIVARDLNFCVPAFGWFWLEDPIE